MDMLSFIKNIDKSIDLSLFLIKRTIMFFTILQDIVKKTSKRRIVAKGGDCNVSLYQVSKKRRQFIKVIYNLL